MVLTAVCSGGGFAGAIPILGEALEGASTAPSD
jgi:hypothetical protein